MRTPQSSLPIVRKEPDCCGELELGVIGAPQALTP
jgi:hypothetical protein